MLVVGEETRGAVGSRRHRRAFWAVAFAFLAVMAFSTAPSPLYRPQRLSVPPDERSRFFAAALSGFMARSIA